MINLRNKSVIRFLGTSNEFVIQQEKKEEKKKKFSTQLVAQVSWAKRRISNVSAIFSPIATWSFIYCLHGSVGIYSKNY